MSTPWAPSRIARTLAAQEWPEIQRQTRVAKGVFGFSCAGHGGMIAIIGVANLDASVVDVYRRLGKIETVKVYPRRWKLDGTVTQWGLARMSWHGQDQLDRLDTDARTVTYEVIIGEEDCEWALVVYAMKDDLADGYFASSSAEMTIYASECMYRWNPEVSAAIIETALAEVGA